jgi:hypothetical protein
MNTNSFLPRNEVRLTGLPSSVGSVISGIVWPVRMNCGMVVPPVTLQEG